MLTCAERVRRSSPASFRHHARWAGLTVDWSTPRPHNDIHNPPRLPYSTALLHSLTHNAHCHQVFTSLTDALQWGEFDAAVLMVPHHLHEICAVQCLEAGKHVLLEKPLAHTLDSCRRLLAAAEGSDRVFMVGENSSHWPEVGNAHSV